MMENLEKLRAIISELEEISYMLDSSKADEIIAYLKKRLTHHEEKAKKVLEQLLEQALDAGTEGSVKYFV